MLRSGTSRNLLPLLWLAALAAPSPAQEASAPGPLEGQTVGVWAPTPLAVPLGLPRYELSFRISPATRRVKARERVTFTNRSHLSTDHLVFHVYPRYRVPESDRPLLAKTLEVLRLSPEEAMDLAGRRIEVESVAVAGQPVPFSYDPNLDTVLVVSLPRPLGPGESVTTELTFAVDLPDKWGRWGHYDGVTFLVNWYPVLAYHDDRGWDRTPFVPWHQPWHQEAGHYLATVELPANQTIASTGTVVSSEPAGNGWKRVRIVAPPSRDFALVCSDRFQVLERQVGRVRVRVHAFPEDADNAARVLEYACEVIPLYERWFGPYYDSEFEVAASFFGWNGNECSGLVLLDRRLLRLPSVGQRYLDHLVTHETCHQWWWNVVGSDGYAETFMDEGFVNAFSAIRLDQKYGRNAPLIVWPDGLKWLPTIGREDLRLGGYYGWRARGGGGSSIQDLKAMGNLETLFSLAYDRGGKVVQMIWHRMGEDRFFGFYREMYTRYAFRTWHYADFKTELAGYDPGGDWPATLDRWLIAHEECDWAVERVEVGQGTDIDPNVRQVTVELKQNGQLVEPTIVLCREADREIRVPIWPDRCPYDVPGARVEQAGETWRVRIDTHGRPVQVEVDPDHALLDARPDNNRWRPEVGWRITPLVTPLDTSSWFQPFDRIGLVAGPFVDQYARAGMRVAAQRMDRWQISGWAGIEPSLSEMIFGGQATLLNVPDRMWNVGAYYENGLYNFHNDQRHSGGRAFLRKRLYTSSSFLVDDPAFFELYYGFGNEFWPGDDGRPTDNWLAALGGRYWMNTQFPYWDPVQGHLIELNGEYGNRAYGSPFDYVRLMGQYGFVRSLPEEWGRVSRLRFAFRAYGGWGWGDEHFLFRLGGGRRLRALDLQSEWGSAVWLLTNEVRFPLWRRIDRDAIDHIVHFKNLYGAAFVDIGQSYFNGGWGPIVFGPGVGLRLDVTLFAFLERATLRLDLAQPIYGPGDRPAYLPGEGGPVLWFGLNQVF